MTHFICFIVSFFALSSNKNVNESVGSKQKETQNIKHNKNVKTLLKISKGQLIENQ